MAFVYRQSNKFEAVFDSAQCKASVAMPGRGIHIYQCQRKPWKDGWCRQHHPDTEKARDETRRKKWEDQQMHRRQVELKNAIRLLREKGYTIIEPEA